jgi:hypothetical protein
MGQSLGNDVFQLTRRQALQSIAAGLGIADHGDLDAGLGIDSVDLDDLAHPNKFKKDLFQPDLSLLRHRRHPVRPAKPVVRPRWTSILPIVAPAAQGVVRGTEGINTYSHLKPGFCLTSTFVLLFFATTQVGVAVI